MELSYFLTPVSESPVIVPSNYWTIKCISHSDSCGFDHVALVGPRRQSEGSTGRHYTVLVRRSKQQIFMNNNFLVYIPYFIITLMKHARLNPTGNDIIYIIIPHSLSSLSRSYIYLLFSFLPYFFPTLLNTQQQ